MIRVLVIDDDPGIRVVLQRNLEHASFEVITAEDGPSGLTAARDQVPDVIVLDLLLPYADGFEVLRQLARDAATSALPVIVLTALTGPEVKDQCRKAGARYVMTKPFDPNALAAQIRLILAVPSTTSL